VSTTAERRASRSVLVRTVKRYLDHEMPDRAATLTFFSMMSLFPGTLVGVTLLGIFGQQSIATRAADYLARHGANPTTARAVQETLHGVLETSGGALGATLAGSILLALYGASGAYSAAGRGLNAALGIREHRPFFGRKLTDILATVCVLVLILVTLVAVFLGGGVAHDLLGTLGLGDTGAKVWSYVRWPVALITAMITCALIYAFAPDVSPRRVRWISPGAALAVLLWIAASVGFAVYLRNFSSYGAAYGAFGAAVVLLVWLYLGANAFLFGAEVNVVLDEGRRPPER
jgi:membrane protein